MRYGERARSMPLAPAPYHPRPVHPVHDGVIFAEEFARRAPRTPECSRLLLRGGMRLGSVWPVYVSPTCSYAQVCSDAGITARGWMQRRACAFHEKEQARQQVTPDTTAVKARIIPVTEWRTRESNDNEKPPATSFVRRRVNL